MVQTKSKIRNLRIPLARLEGQACVVYRKEKGGNYSKYIYSMCYSKWALSEIQYELVRNWSRYTGITQLSLGF